MNWITKSGERAIIKSGYKVGQIVTLDSPCGREKGFQIIGICQKNFVGWNFKYKIKKDDREFIVDEIDIEV